MTDDDVEAFVSALRLGGVAACDFTPTDRIILALAKQRDTIAATLAEREAELREARIALLAYAPECDCCDSPAVIAMGNRLRCDEHDDTEPEYEHCVPVEHAPAIRAAEASKR